MEIKTNNSSLSDIQLKETLLKQGYHRENNKIWFGFYPQSIPFAEAEPCKEIQRDEVLKNYPESTVYQTEKGEIFLGVRAKLPDQMDYYPSTSFKFDIRHGFSYAVKFEPIEWEIIKEQNGEALLWSKRVLFSTAFAKEDIPSYENSIVRKYLNENFISRAFYPNQREMLLDSTITCDENKSLTDKIFLLGLQDFNDYSLYSLEKKSTDYAVCRTTNIDRYYKTERGSYNSFYATKDIKTANSPFKNMVVCVGEEGSTSTYAFASDTRIGIVPACKIKL